MRDRKEYNRLWRAKNPARVKQYHERYWSACRAIGYNATRKWRKNNPERVVWASMLWRCNNEKASNYQNYGGRGIKVLYSNFVMFLADVGYRPSLYHSIDRVDNSKGYMPGNCRWATDKQQRANRRDTI